MTAEDEIRNLISAYCHALDGHDPEGYVALFSKNTRMYTRRATREGQAGIQDHINDVYTRWPQNLRSKHTLGSSVLKVEGDTGEGVTSVVVFRSMDNGPWEIAQAGHYFDKYIKEDGKWKFAERRIEADFSLVP